MTKGHPRLRTPLIVEAVFELRYSSRTPYGILPGQLFELMKQTFPVAEELPAAQIALDVAPAPFARHRFRTSDGTRMVQLGQGMVSVNHTGYVGYDTFRQDIDPLLAACGKLSLLTALERLGLRYINRAPLDQPWSEIVTYQVTAPAAVESRDSARRFTWRTGLDELGALQTTVAWPVPIQDHPPALVLDFDASVQLKAARVETILEWIDEAHNTIYEAFKSSLQPDYFKKLGGRTHAAHS